MKPADKQHQGACQETELSPNSRSNLTIDHLPDEVLLEIFDAHRRGNHPYDQWRWKYEYVWFNLAHVCRKWRAVIFASSSRLDLGIIVMREKPHDIKAILSGHLPILIEYWWIHKYEITSALWRMRAALKHNNRVRKIAFKGSRANFDEFFKVTNCAFPALEHLSLQFHEETKFPDTFLRGPDLSELHLPSLNLVNVSLASASKFLLSATALTGLSLQIDTAFGPSPETSLLACFQGMPCLRGLCLYLPSSRPEPPPQTSTPKDIVPLSNLTHFYYSGHIEVLDALTAGLSAPLLHNAELDFLVGIQPPIVHLPRFINEIEEHYHTIQVHIAFREDTFHFSLLTQSGSWERCFHACSSRHSRDSIVRMGSMLSKKLTAVEELHLVINKWSANISENLYFIPWRRFYKQFPGVKALRGGVNNHIIALTLLHDRGLEESGLAFLPALEEIDLGKTPYYERDRGPQLAAFQPFVSARQQAGRQVKVFFST